MYDEQGSIREPGRGAEQDSLRNDLALAYADARNEGGGASGGGVSLTMITSRFSPVGAAGPRGGAGALVSSNCEGVCDGPTLAPISSPSAVLLCFLFFLRFADFERADTGRSFGRGISSMSEYLL